MKGFMSDWREAFVISGCYGMGDPLARSSPMGTKSHSHTLKRPLLQRLEMTRPGASESKKTLDGPFMAVIHESLFDPSVLIYRMNRKNGHGRKRGRCNQERGHADTLERDSSFGLRYMG